MSADRREAGARVRAEAARCVARVVAGGRSLEVALAELDLAPRDVGFGRALVSGTLRWHHRLAWQASQLLQRPLPASEAVIAALIRVGLYQLEFTRVPAHAAVSATVAASKRLARAGHAKLVNALLRRYERERESLAARMVDVPEALHAHPRWLLERFEHDWPQRWREIVAANNALPPMWLRINERRTSREAYLARLAAAGIEAAASADVPSAVLLARPRPVAELPGFAAGEVSVQDAAAQRAAWLLGAAPGERVLDACAAPGGKTAHVLERCPKVAELWALDRDPARLALVESNLARLGLEARLEAADAGCPERWWDGRAFERILLDAPCSATGVIRRHPDIKVLRRPADIGSSRDQQRRLLGALWPLLAPGGRLLYATCSVLHEENEDLIRGFVSTTEDADRDPAVLAVATLPGEANMDGFYYACLAKRDMTSVSHLQDH